MGITFTNQPYLSRTSARTVGGRVLEKLVGGGLRTALVQCSSTGNRRFGGVLGNGLAPVEPAGALLSLFLSHHKERTDYLPALVLETITIIMAQRLYPGHVFSHSLPGLLPAFLIIASLICENLLLLTSLLWDTPVCLTFFIPYRQLILFTVTAGSKIHPNIFWTKR
ncbi:hypothetical protein DTO271D3_2217 [Paecilomyces variotii]|nr:hypothetical protein DTO271D3_2217 [Paecilomyces variotii]